MMDVAVVVLDRLKPFGTGLPFEQVGCYLQLGLPGGVPSEREIDNVVSWFPILRLTLRIHGTGVERDVFGVAHDALAMLVAEEMDRGSTVDVVGDPVSVDQP